MSPTSKLVPEFGEYTIDEVASAGAPGTITEVTTKDRLATKANLFFKTTP